MPAILTATLALGCTGRGAAPRPAQPPDVLLVSIDTLRADHLGCYGDRRGTTPSIDGLAREGIVFEAAFTTAPITLPAHASMLTGLTPPRHGARDNGAYRVPDGVHTLAEALHGAGYQTAAFIGGLPLAASNGLAQGFDRYDDAIASRALAGSQLATRAEREAEQVLDLALDWLQGTEATRPWFAFIHLYDPHSPYEKSLPGSHTPEYAGEIAYVDRALQQFRSRLAPSAAGRGRLTVVTSDHGEGLGEHGEQTHCVFVYDSTLRVPLVIHWPGVVEPRRVADSVSLVDLAPTLLDLLGLPPLPAPDGQSLKDAIYGRASSRSHDLYFESLFGELRFGWAPLRGLRRGTVKYIEAPLRELYDLSADPGELNNRYAASPDLAAGLRESLADIGEGESSRIELDEETAAALASLGYVAAPPARGVEAGPPLDPKEQIEVYEEFQRAHAEALHGRLREALAILAPLESSLARSPYYFLERGNFAAEAQQWPLAIDSYKKCLALEPANEDALLNLGVAFLKTGAPAEARSQFEALIRIQPDHARARLYCGLLLYRNFHDNAGARLHWTRFLELAPNHPEAGEIRRALEGLPAS